MQFLYTYLFLTDLQQNWFLAIVRLCLMLCVTLHVLYNIRDTRASIGWIGFSWLMPITGFVIYSMFGINRVTKRAQKLANRRPWRNKRLPNLIRYHVRGHFYPLAQTVEGFTNRPLLTANNVEVLYNGDEAYPAMLRAIRSAMNCVFLSSYILRDDAIGNTFIEALNVAQRRGATVRVLIDGIGSGYFYSSVTKKLRKNGIKYGRFMHSFWPWKMPFINLRTHRKILIIDGEIGFIGGLNIANENVISRKPKQPVSDTHFRLSGTIVHELTEVFLQDWFFITGENLAEEKYFPKLPVAGDMACRIVTAGPDTDLEKIKYTMMQAFSLARESIRIMTPYFLPDDRFLSILCVAAIRGVRVDIVTPEKSNQRLVDWARNINNKLPVQLGCNMWLARPPFNHSKLMVVDRIWSFVGSSNIDMRSLRLNFEINMEVYHENFAQNLDDFICAHRHIPLTSEELEKSPFPKRMRDSVTRLLLPYL